MFVLVLYRVTVVLARVAIWLLCSTNVVELVLDQIMELTLDWLLDHQYIGAGASEFLKPALTPVLHLTLGKLRSRIQDGLR